MHDITSLLPDWLPDNHTTRARRPISEGTASQLQGFKQSIQNGIDRQTPNQGFSITTIFFRYKKTAEGWTSVSLELRFSRTHTNSMRLSLKSYERGDFISPIKKGRWFIPSVFNHPAYFGMVPIHTVTDLQAAFALMDRLVDYFCSDHFAVCYLASLHARNGFEPGCSKCPNQLTCLSEKLESA